jgi:hypothetical protein
MTKPQLRGQLILEFTFQYYLQFIMSKHLNASEYEAARDRVRNSNYPQNLISLTSRSSNSSVKLIFEQQ